MGKANTEICEGWSGEGDPVRERVAAEQAAALYRKGLLPFLTNVVNGAVLVYVLGGVVGRGRAAGWLVALTVLTVLRVGLWRLHHRRTTLLRPRGWALLFTVGFGLSGLVWGSTALLLFAPDSIVHHALVAFVVGGMVAGATATASTYMPAYGVFALAALSPLVVRLLATGQPVDTAMGATLALFGLAMAGLARRAGYWFTQTTALRIRNDQLVKNLSARNEFLAVASHELRTPLSTMRLIVQTLEQQAGGAGTVDPANLSVRVQRLRRQVARLTGLVDTVLVVSSAGKGAPHLEPHEVDLAVVVRSVVQDMVASTPSAAELLSLEIEGSLVGSWDPLRVEQIVTNLMSNALKYGAGSAVTVSLRETGDDVVLTVQDRGPGIAPADRERIFEQFYRTGARPGPGGMGLGLSVVRDLVRAMRGSVAVASTPGQGARFTVRLPRAASSAPEARPHRADRRDDVLGDQRSSAAPADREPEPT